MGPVASRQFSRYAASWTGKFEDLWDDIAAAPEAVLVIAPEPELDIAEAYVWYEGRRAGLGEEFLSSVDAGVESIRRRPQMYPVIRDAYRQPV